MCGVFGSIHRYSASEVTQAMLSMRERGPDSQNVIVSNDGCIGAVRLAIVDIDHGQQPMVSPDNQHVLALNGEIYNYKQLRRQLLKKGWVFKTNCDTEVVLALMATEGVDAIQKLQGIFGFVWLNLEQKFLVGVRDHFGIKPLFLHAAGKKSAFSSKISVLLDIFDRKLKPNYQALHDFYISNRERITKSSCNGRGASFTCTIFAL